MERKMALHFTFYFIILFLTLGLFSLYGRDFVDNKHSERIDEIYQDIKGETEAVVTQEDLKKEIDIYRNQFNNSDIIGSLKIEGTSIDTLIVQGSDNDFYLNHAIDKSYNKYGSIYLDYLSSIFDSKLIFYGHNSKTLNTIFRELQKYIDKSFYEDHQYINLLTESGREVYQIFSVMITKDSNRHTRIQFNDTGYIEHLYWLKESSIYEIEVDIEDTTKIIVLQTCYYDPAGSNLIISAKKVN